MGFFPPPQFPMISEFGENTNSYCSFESKETALLHSENDGLQQRVNVLTHEVRGSQEETGHKTVSQFILKNKNLITPKVFLRA